MRKREGEEGYTLLEVLVAFVILAGAVIMSFRIFADGLARLNAADRQIGMVATAQALLSDLQLKQSLPAGTTSGLSGDYGWTITLTPLEATSDAPNALSLIHATIEIRAKEEKETAYRLETNLLGLSE